MNAQAAYATPEDIISIAVAAASSGLSATREALDELPVPIYTADRDGRITYFNEACVAFAGRTPVIGQDSWCVTWKLFTTDGEYLPHDRCPMAVAIHEKRAIRGVGAIAERPDGTRVDFVPYPTPLIDGDGEVIGAVNILVDVTHRKRAEHFRSQAIRCRRIAAMADDPATIRTLEMMASEYDGQADGTA